MTLNKRACRTLCKSIARSMNVPTGIFDPEGMLIGHTDCATSEETARLRNQLTLLIHTEISAPTSFAFPFCMRTVPRSERSLCPMRAAILNT